VILVLGTYVKPFERTDEVFERHRDFMAAQVAAGTVLCSGPREGGSVIVAYGDDPAAVQTLLAQDPFAQEGIATFELQQFKAGLVDPRIAPEGLIA
jgi:uncharacterized protein YciI